MSTKHNILVALSGEDCQDKIIQKAVALANGKDVSFTFLHILKDLGLELFRIEDMVDETKLKEKMTYAISACNPSVAFDVAIGFGDPSTEILKKAEEHDAQMIIVGSNDKSPGLGSTARKVLQHSYLPVYVVKNSRMHDHKLLHPLDLNSSVPEIKCDICERLLGGYVQEYVYAHDGIKKLAYKYQNVTTFQADDLHKKITQGLAKAKDTFAKLHPEASLELLEVMEDTPQELVEYAKDKGYNLISMTSKHSGGLSSIIFGSVAAKVAKMSEADLLITYDRS